MPIWDLNNITDYLQIDVDPAHISYEVLLKIPFHKHKFRVITFEHDYYANPTSDIREKSREYLKSFGYELIVNDVCVNTQDFVSVKSFGAVGDGVTDDTAAIQAALDSGNLSVFIPKGIYIISSTLL